MSADLLFELGTEELPPKSLKLLSDTLLGNVTQALKKAELTYGEAHAYATPRRLALVIEDLPLCQPDRLEVRRGPAISAPEKAIAGFAKSCNANVDDLSLIETDKGAYYQFTQTIIGAQTSTLIGAIIDTALNHLPIAKRMRWGACRTEFVRPLHWFILRLGDELIDHQCFGLTNSQYSMGHRFMRPKPLLISAAKQYTHILKEQGCVIADFNERKAIIRSQVNAQAQTVNANAVIDDSLLDEVTALVEWPVSLCGRFDKTFLDLPDQALISSMKAHQKYFHLVDDEGALLPFFITVANIASSNPQAIIAGNEKVIHPRLADAAFFFAEDQKTPLDNRLPALDKIIFQKQLGTLAQKTQRISQLATHLGCNIQASETIISRAAQLSKTDLCTDMVLEFADLQGQMGHIYALNQGEDPIVAAAIEQHYWPRFAKDNLPESPEASALAIADRLDTLVGLFGIKQPPTGSKDPYALRRAALGILRICIEQSLDFNINKLIETAYDLYDQLKDPLPQDKQTTCQKVSEFLFERLRAYYEDQGIRTEVYLSVLAIKPASPLDFDRRIKAVASFMLLSQAEQLSASNKRVNNILEKNQTAVNSEIKVNKQLLAEPSETQLYDALIKISQYNQSSDKDYTEALTKITSIAGPLDAFFTNTMVMAEDADIRTNRLALMAMTLVELRRVADISLLH